MYQKPTNSSTQITLINFILQKRHLVGRGGILHHCAWNAAARAVVGFDAVAAGLDRL